MSSTNFDFNSDPSLATQSHLHRLIILIIYGSFSDSADVAARVNFAVIFPWIIWPNKLRFWTTTWRSIGGLWNFLQLFYFIMKLVNKSKGQVAQKKTKRFIITIRSADHHGQSSSPLNGYFPSTHRMQLQQPVWHLVSMIRVGVWRRLYAKLHGTAIQFLPHEREVQHNKEVLCELRRTANVSLNFEMRFYCNTNRI